MYLGIEIGGTKLQLGVGAPDGSPLVEVDRYEVARSGGATAILDQVKRSALRLIDRHPIEAVGCGFGGPVDSASGVVIKSHHVDGWDGFDLRRWCRTELGHNLQLANDADVAGLAEARLGAGRDASVVFYVTVGTGIGGGLIVDRKIFGRPGAGAAELGHLRPGLSAADPNETLESLASGWGIAAAARNRVSGPQMHKFGPLKEGLETLDPESVRRRLIEVEEAEEPHVADLMERCDGQLDGLTAKMVVEAADAGNPVARELFDHAVSALGWAIAQMITLLAPEIVVIGGGVALAGEELFFAPLRNHVTRYVFPPRVETYRIVPAELGEEVVVHGAISLASGSAEE